MKESQISISVFTMDDITRSTHEPGVLHQKHLDPTTVMYKLL